MPLLPLLGTTSDSRVDYEELESKAISFHSFGILSTRMVCHRYGKRAKHEEPVRLHAPNSESCQRRPSSYRGIHEVGLALEVAARLARSISQPKRHVARANSNELEECRRQDAGAYSRHTHDP